MLYSAMFPIATSIVDRSTKTMGSAQLSSGDLINAISDKRWDEVRRSIKWKNGQVNERYLGITLLRTIVLKIPPENLVLEILDFAEEEVIDDVHQELAGWSILHYLAAYGYVNALRRALEKSQQRVNWRTENGLTPLHVLLNANHSFRIHLQGLQVLLDAGADSKLKDQNGKTPLDMFVHNMCEEYGNKDYGNTKREKQKEEILQILHKVTVPGEVLTRGKPAMSAFNKELEKGGITVNHAHLVIVVDDFDVIALWDRIREELTKEVHRTDFAIEDTRLEETEDIDGVINENNTYILNIHDQQLNYTHQNPLNSEAVFIIGFNLVEGMHAKRKCRVSRMAVPMTNDMTNLQFIKYRMELIFTYAVTVEEHCLKSEKPKIVVVGTNSEDLQGNDEEKKLQVEKQFKILFQEIKGTPYECYVVRDMYFINNESPSGSEMLKLRQDICRFLKSMPKTIPLTWHKFQRELRKIGEKVHVQYHEVRTVANKCGISKENIIHTINYLHDLGIVMYFEHNELLKDTVVINPEEANNIIKELITAVKPADQMVELWHKLDNEGILEEELIRHIWKREFSEDEINVFLELMKEFGLMCEQIKSKTPSRSFFVPCRSKYSKEKVAITLDGDRMVSIYMTFDGFLIDRIFHCIVVRLIERVQATSYTTVPKLCYNKAVIDIGKDHTLSLGQVIIENKPAVKFEISRNSEVSNGNPADTKGLSRNVCIQVFEHLKKELKVLKSTMKYTSSAFRVLCWSGHCDYHFQNMEECLRNDSIRCGKVSLKTKKIEALFNNKTGGNQIFLEDDDLFLISKDVGNEWTSLGVRLGLSWNRINQISTYHSKRLPECTLKMLTEWRDKQMPEANQVRIMAKALIKEERIDLANKLLDSQRNLKSDEKRSAGYLTDGHMLLIAKKLKAGEMRILGTTLGISDSELDKIKYNFGQSILDATIEMLVKWRERQDPNENHLDTLSNALNNIERRDITMTLETECQ
ncbi:uncharacterized protein LOC117100870 [Anneissia japonica]|uniref:uncharacterized protein LOC117100870 n=1 Tax=Anneissia japonica TaxID=1529436 RepID=UPI0014257C16|nr:uncharacterized protein LOC117100870 [Anneissia japonica]